MNKAIIFNKIKFMERRMHARKKQAECTEKQSTADLYGILKGSDDMTQADIDAVKIRVNRRA